MPLTAPDIVGSDKRKPPSAGRDCASRGCGPSRHRPFFILARRCLGNCNFLHSSRISLAYLDSLIWLTMLSGMHGEEVPAPHPTIRPGMLAPHHSPQGDGAHPILDKRRRLSRISAACFP